MTPYQISRITRINRIRRYYELDECEQLFEKLEDRVYKCVQAKDSIHKLFLNFKEQFPDEKIIYSCGRKPHLTKKGNRAGKSTRMPPRQREFVIKFSDAANEAFFLLKYSTEVED